MSLSAQQTLVIIMVSVVIPAVCACVQEREQQRATVTGVTGEAFLLRLHHSFVLPVIVSASTSTAPSLCLPSGLAVSLSLCLLVH